MKNIKYFFLFFASILLNQAFAFCPPYQAIQYIVDNQDYEAQSSDGVLWRSITYQSGLTMVGYHMVSGWNSNVNSNDVPASNMYCIYLATNPDTYLSLKPDTKGYFTIKDSTHWVINRFKSNDVSTFNCDFGSDQTDCPFEWNSNTIRPM